MRKLITVIVLSLLSFNVVAQDCHENKEDNKNLQQFAQSNVDIFAHASMFGWLQGDKYLPLVRKYAVSATKNNLGLNGADPNGFKITHKSSKRLSQKNTRYGIRKVFLSKVRVFDRVEISATYTVKMHAQEKNGRCEILEVSSVSSDMD
jgi:hypothetical protein